MNSSVPNGSMVIERWCPEAARRPTLDEAPVFYPSEEEFKDSLKYIASICQCVEPYGICRIVPPPSWNLPCTLKERTAWQTSKFATHVQKLDKLQNRDSTRKMANHDRNLAKRRRLSRMWVETGTSYGARENDLDCQKTREFGFELGPEFTLEAFQKYADDFKEKYFHLRSNQDDFQKQWEASVENIEEEYWRIVEMPTEEIEVLYGSDIETGAFGSGFPKSFTEAMNSDLVEKYVKSEWNLNNIARHPASMLAFESEDISGVILPWLYVGMCFSSFCWHVEDHHLYSLNYMHWGAPKIWYGVPGKDASKFEAAMRKHLPDLFEEQPDLLHKLVTQLSPSVLKSEAIPIYRCVQRPGEFVVTFPRAYHAGFSCGFNCAEAVNFAPIDWLPQGQRAVELYREQGRHTALSHDKLLLGAAREAVRAHWELQFLRKNTLNNLRWKDVCGKDGILTHALKKRVHMEQVQREYLSNPLKSMKMDVNFDEKIERECIVCHYDLHLSAVSCQCSPDSYACLTHAKQLCSCAWSMRSILFRYEINELNILLEALGGKLSAIHRWANLDLGLTLSSYVSRNKSEPDSIDKLLMEGAKLKEQALPTAINSNSISEKPRPCKEINVTMSRVSSSEVIESDQRRFNSTGTIVGPSPQKQDKNQLPSAYIHTIKGEVIGDNHVQDSSFSGHSIQSGEGALGSNSSSSSFQVCQLSREDTSYSKCIHGEGNSQDSPALAPKDKHLSKSNLMASKVNIFLQSEAQSALKECDVRERAKLKEQALPTAINSNAISEKPRPCKEINVTMSRVSSSEVKECDQRRFNSTSTIVGPSPQKQDKNQLPSAYIHTIKGEVIGDNHVQDSSFSGHSIQSGEGALGSNSSSSSFQVCQLSREDTSYSKCIHGEGNSQESPALAPKDKHLSKSNLMASKVNIFLQSEAQSALKECDVRERAKLKEQALPTAINSNAISEKPRPCKEINVTMSRVSSSEVKESDQRRFNSTGTIVGPSPQKQDKNQLPSAYIHTRKGEVIGDNHVQDSSFSGPSIQSGEGALGSNSSSLSFQVCQLSREDSSYSKCIHGEGNSQESPSLAPKDKHLSNSNLLASKVNILLQSEAQSALKECDVKDCGLNTHKSNASVMSEMDANSVPVKDKVDHLLHHLQTTRGEIGAGEIGTNHCNVMRRPSYQNLSCNLTNNTPLENHVQDSALREPSHDNMTISARDLQRHQPQGNGRSFDVGINEMAGSCSNTERVQPVTRPRSRVNYCRQKVPYISNVVRRINYIATPLEYGSVIPGKLWSNSQVIFPKGFKSRVMYISVLDPAKMCYYISEILDAGLTRPVFMVSVEECPSEVFIHISAAKCWDLVRERVNQEISKHNNLGRVNLPHMQPPGCINGLEMFGFSSSAIIQAIEAIDCKRICSEYWKCRPESRTKHHSVPVSCTRTLLHKLKEEPNHYPSTLLGALFKKANHEELQSMRSILVDNKRSSNYEALVQLLNTEIHSRQN